MDAIVLLKEDHKLIKQLFREYEKVKGSGTAAAKRTVVDQIRRELVTHSFIEETVFYPAVRAEAPDAGADVLESVEEHHVMAWLLSELQDLAPTYETYDAKVTVLIENVTHHIGEEESDLFPAVREALGRNRLKDLGEEMAAAKAKAPSDPLALSSAKS